MYTCMCIYICNFIQIYIYLLSVSLVDFKAVYKILLLQWIQQWASMLIYLCIWTRFFPGSRCRSRYGFDGLKLMFYFMRFYLKGWSNFTRYDQIVHECCHANLNSPRIGCGFTVLFLLPTQLVGVGAGATVSCGDSNLKLFDFQWIWVFFIDFLGIFICSSWITFPFSWANIYLSWFVGD